MKKKIIIISTAIFIAATSTTATLFALNKPQEVPKATTSQAPQEPLKQEVVNEPAPAPEAPQQAPAPASEQAIPTNEDLIAKYGWSTGNDRWSIDLIISLYPQWFTDKERVTAFDYLNKAATSNVTVGTEPKTINSISMVRWYLQSNYQPKTWKDLGELTGIDNSYYSWVQ